MAGGGCSKSTRECDLVKQYILGAEVSTHLLSDSFQSFLNCLAFTSCVGVTISVNYLIDSYHDISGDALVTVILVRNTMSFAVGYG